MRSIEVWDLPTRVFHWALAALVVFDLIVTEDEGLALVLHTYAGYLVLLLLLFRLAWGFVGGEHALFRDFLVPWSGVRAYAAGLMTGSPPRVAGHNPLGGWMIALMLATLALIVVSGLALQGEEGGRGPVSGFVSKGLAEALGEVHEGAANFMILLIVVHVLGVIASSILYRENLTRAMVTGRKAVAESSPFRDAQSAGGWRAAALAVALALVGGWLVANTTFPAGEGERGDELEEPEERALDDRGSD